MLLLDYQLSRAVRKKDFVSNTNGDVNLYVDQHTHVSHYFLVFLLWLEEVFDYYCNEVSTLHMKKFNIDNPFFLSLPSFSILYENLAAFCMAHKSCNDCAINCLVKDRNLSPSPYPQGCISILLLPCDPLSPLLSERQASLSDRSGCKEQLPHIATICVVLRDTSNF
jgi:hypothetical protein